MSQFWNERVRSTSPYVPGEQPRERRFIKLNTNENPYGPSPKAISRMQEALGQQLRLYPNPTGEALREAVGEEFGVSPEWVFLGNGSDEILAFCFQAFFDKNRAILFPDVTYSFYRVYAEFYGIPYRRVPVGPDLCIDVADYIGQDDGVGGIVLANPNAPTGICIGLRDIEDILRHHPDKVLILDEAYIDFGGESAVPLTKEYPNLLVVQTFSKSRSLAGLRIGFAIGQEELIRGLAIVKNCFNSYTLDQLALAGGEAALRDGAHFEETVQKIIRTREWVGARLSQMGFSVTPSKANFLFVSHGNIAAEALFQYYREQGILVRHFSDPKIDQFLRISIGTDEEMQELIGVTEKFLHRRA